MADDIAQFCQIEYEGIKFVFRGSIELAQMLARIMKAVLEAGKKGKAQLDEASLAKGGEKKNYAEIVKASKSGTPQHLMVRAEDVEELTRIAGERGLRWHLLEDPNPYDKKVPFAVVDVDFPAFAAIAETLTERRLEMEKGVLQKKDKDLAELKEKARNVDSESEEGKALEAQIENVTQARDEVQALVDDGEKTLATPIDQRGFTLEEYLKEFKGSDFEAHPEIALAEQQKGVETGPKMSAKECLQPIRDKSLMPESALMFYVPEVGAIVTREFKLDQDTDTVYSDYSFKLDNGEVKSFTDHNMTKAEWNANVLPGILQETNMLEGTMCRAFDNYDKLERYLEYHGKLENPERKKIEEKIRNGEPVFSSPEAKHEILQALKDQEKAFASAPVDENSFDIMCTPNMFTNRGGKLDFKISEDEHIQFSSVSVSAELGGNGVFKLHFDEKSNPTFIKMVGDARTEIPMPVQEAKRRMDEALGKGVGGISATAEKNASETSIHKPSKGR